MMKAIKILLAAAFALAAVACSSQKPVTNAASELGITCEPRILEVVGGKVDAAITINFPAGFLKANAMLVTTPVIVYADGKRTGPAYIYQGEQIKANYRVIPLAGAQHTQNVSFDYVDGMEQCVLELQSKLVIAGKERNLPAIKVADGCIATYRLADFSGEFAPKPDGFERISTYSTETSILFDVNSSDVRNNSQNKNALDVYKSYLRELENDPRYNVTSAEIVAYASPEGGVDLNDKLSEDRAKAAEKTWTRMGNGLSDSIKVSSVGQDWEGFKEAMANSDIEDKDLILRVLSMYSDPEVREAEIKNLSFIYEDIKKDVFPGLRRASFVVNAEHTGYSDEELQEIAKQQLIMLSEPEILHLAAITDDPENKKFYLRTTTERWGSNTGYYNLAVIALEENKIDVALAYLTHTNEADPDVLNLLGAIEMRRGRYQEALDYFEMAGTDDAKKNAGSAKIALGDYPAAAEALAGTGSRNEALAFILAGQADKAAAAASDASPRDSYIAAVAAARLGDAAGVKEHLAKASEDPVFAEKAAKDAEFADFR
ncbi:MAG: OmpA family protein [Bacteroidales bacterium]|nr:OmpA family protein [Bacteroidales bacterium]